MTRHLLPVLFLLLAPRASADDWADDYRRGVAALEKGRLRAARTQLEKAAAAQPEPRAGARAHGTRTFDYLPWLQLSTLAYREGDLEEAAGHLARSLQAGVAAGSEEGRTRLAKQELLIENLALLRAAGPPSESSRSARDLQREQLLAAQVAKACGEPPPERQAKRPWYYHYLIARKLAEHGDALGTVQRLAEALRRRDEPSESARTYGMKVVAYRPYLELGKAHARLGNWSGAADALELSVRLDELGDDDGRAARERDELLAGARLRRNR
jgi:hypothetical protein